MALLLSLMLALLIVYSIKSCCESSFTVTTPIYTLKDANVGLKKRCYCLTVRGSFLPLDVRSDGPSITSDGWSQLTGMDRPALLADPLN